MQYKKEIETLLYVQGEEGVSPSHLKILFELSVPDGRKLLKDFQDEWNNSDEHGIKVVEYGDFFKFSTREEYNEMLNSLVSIDRKKRLSYPAMETLGIIAYKEPITKSEISEIRGIASDGTVATLLHKGLVEEKGISEEKGKPVLYGVAPKFYDYFNLKSLKDLPELSNFSQAEKNKDIDLFSSQREEDYGAE